MAHDILRIENDVFEYDAQGSASEQRQKAILDENDELWTELRHQHIANVTQ
jgi:syntaxin-binding protein 1